MSSTHTSITSTFHSSNSASWLSTSFLLTSTSLQPLFGRVSDCIGRKAPFLFSLWVFVLSTIWCAVAGSMESIVAARAVCGLGAGGMLCMGAIILSDILPLEVRAGYQSINNLAFGVGSALGAAIGGAIADYMGWRWGFAVQVPPAVVCILLCMYNLPDQEVEKDSDNGIFAKLKDFDFAGSVYLTLCVGILVLALNTGGNLLPWSHPIVLGSFATSLFFTVLFLRAEQRAISPIMPLHLLQKNPRAAMMLGSVASSIAMQTIFFNLPLFFQTVMLESARKAGSRLLIPTVGNMVCSVGVGYVINRTKVVRPTMRVGSLTLFFGGLGLCFLSSSFSELAVCLLLMPANAGVGLAYPSIMMGTLASSEQHEMAVATSTLILFRSIGNVMGVSTSSLIVQNVLVWGLGKKLIVGETAGLVSDEQKVKIIEMVRERVTAIFDLQGEIQQQVMDAYKVSLRTAFGWAALCAFIMLCATFNLVIPSMDNKKKKAEEHVDSEVTAMVTEESSLLRASK
ncbi:MFS general substrate transporter [Ascobolus immersus RN42]|uniref:MFS general substrate transporter n=1 Tax=Ascobolus immersus RN42 TaxID=1160509 RepID=A0A3N4IIP8_ASCIM|nr:MFS general substrate transporter [Ascobolus immersus RN42]